MKEILLNSIFILSLSIFVALFAGIYSFKTLTAPMKIMFVYAWVSAVLGGIISIMSLKGINNISLVNGYSLVEFLIISRAFYIAFEFKRKIFYPIYISTTLLLVLIYGISTLQDPTLYNNTLKALISVIMVMVSISYLILQFYNGKLEGKEKPFLLLAVGTFMYFASSFLIGFTGSDNSTMNEMQVLWIYLIHSIFYVIFVIILTLAFLICRQQSEHSNL